MTHQQTYTENILELTSHNYNNYENLQEVQHKITYFSHMDDNI